MVTQEPMPQDFNNMSSRHSQENLCRAHHPTREAPNDAKGSKRETAFTHSNQRSEVRAVSDQAPSIVQPRATIADANRRHEGVLPQDGRPGDPRHH